MKKLARFALAAFFLPGIAVAQNLPAIDVFAGYSYLHFNQPTSTQTQYEQLQLNGWEVSASVGLFHHLAVEGDLAGHIEGDCADVSDVTCSDFSYMIGPRFTFGDHSSKITGFIHALIGQDRATLLGLSPTSSTPNVNDTSLEVAVGAGVDYWFYRHIGLQIGPADYVYSNHLNDSGASSQGSFRVGGGIAFRFGGNIGGPEPKEATSESGGHRSWTRPWHKTYPEGQTSESHPSSAPTPRPGAPAAATTISPSHGMPIHSLGLVAAPQEFDGAKVLELVPGGVAEMASLHVGDLITSIDGKPVRTPMELAVELSDKTGKVKIGIRRGTFTTETVVILSAQ